MAPCIAPCPPSASATGVTLRFNQHKLINVLDEEKKTILTSSRASDPSVLLEAIPVILSPSFPLLSLSPTFSSPFSPLLPLPRGLGRNPQLAKPAAKRGSGVSPLEKFLKVYKRFAALW